MESVRLEPCYNVAVVGATGLVGEVLLQVLVERRFPIRRLRALASAKSEGTTVSFNGEPIVVQEATPDAFAGVDFVFFAATDTLSETLAPEAVKRGAVVIDKSATWRLHKYIPLIVPEVNGDELRGKGRRPQIIACPNCTTIGAVMALEPIRRAVGLQDIVMTTLQAASGAGRPGVDELAEQLEAEHHDEPCRVQTFPKQLAGNVLPVCGSFRGEDTTEELKLRDEMRKILGLPGLSVSATCTRVPVAVGHSASILFGTERPLTVDGALKAFEGFPGVTVVDSLEDLPTPLDVAGKDNVFVGRIRMHVSDPWRLWLWATFDNLRKGAATNAVQIAELLIRE